MTRKSEFVTIADEMQSWLRPHLKEMGFKVKGRTYNRLNANGLTEVINMQLGNSDPPGTTYIPDFTQNMYGLFTINLGVFVPEVHKYLDGWKLGSMIRETDCCVRSRLGSIEQQDEDIWWRLVSDPQLFSLIRDTLVKNALPFFERFSTREKILREWEDQVENTPEFWFSAQGCLRHDLSRKRRARSSCTFIV